MPQLNKGGKFVYGLSEIHSDNTIHFPPTAVSAYNIAEDGKIIIFTGAKPTGGFCVTNKTLLSHSKLAHFLSECEPIATYSASMGTFVKYKGRSYSWLPISPEGVAPLPKHTMDFLHLNIGDKLMCIKSSDIAFTMGAHGPLMDKVHRYKGSIERY